MNDLSKLLYTLSRWSRDLKSLEQCFRTGSLLPLIKRLVNKLIGRLVVSRLWWK